MISLLLENLFQEDRKKSLWPMKVENRYQVVGCQPSSFLHPQFNYIRSPHTSSLRDLRLFPPYISRST